MNGSIVLEAFLALLELGSKLVDVFARRAPPAPPEPIPPPPERQDAAIRAEAEARLRERFPVPPSAEPARGDEDVYP